MWKDEQCIVVAFLEKSIIDESGLEDVMEGIQTRIQSYPESTEYEAPEWLMHISPEDLAAEMLEFARKEFPDSGWRGINLATRMFMQDKGVQPYMLPADINMKIQKATYLAEREFQKMAEEESRIRLEHEKEELPSLVNRCVDWARAHGLKRVTVADVDAFILEKNLDIMNETKRSVYSLANVQLRSSK